VANALVRALEVSILMAAEIAAGLCRAGSPGLNSSMMRRAEPQHGHGLRDLGGRNSGIFLEGTAFTW
jgi:hypothetical protein